MDETKYNSVAVNEYAMSIGIVKDDFKRKKLYFL